MGLYKRCQHTGRMRDRCDDPWWGSYQYRGRLHRVSLGRRAGEDIQGKEHARVVYERFRQAVREGRSAGSAPRESHDSLTFSRFADVYIVSFLPIVRHTLPGIGGQAFPPDWGPPVYGS